jgi:hypothetical protein
MFANLCPFAIPNSSVILLQTRKFRIFLTHMGKDVRSIFNLRATEKEVIFQLRYRMDTSVFQLLC